MAVWQGPSDMAVWQGPSDMAVWQGPSDMAVWQGPSDMAVWQGPWRIAIMATRALNINWMISQFDIYPCLFQNPRGRPNRA